MLAFLGWNPGTTQEIFTELELIEAFSLDRIGKSGARFDPEKARWFNHQYLQLMSDEEVSNTYINELSKKGIETEFSFVKKIVSLEKAEEAVKNYIQTNELNMGQILNSFRLTIVGSASGPSLFEIISLIGKEETIARIQKGLDTIKR